MISGLLTNFIGFLKASRIPNLIVIASTQYLVAIFLIKVELSILYDFRFFLLVASTLMIAAAGYIINDYYDQKIDMINRPDKVVVGIIFKRRLALISHSALNLSGILIGFYLDVFIGAIHIFSSFILWFYSNHLRRIPFLGNLVIATMTGLALVIVNVYFRTYSPLTILYAFFAGTITMIREIIKDIEDVKGESAFGCVTVPVIWGIRGAKFVIYGITLVGIFLLLTFLIKYENQILWIYFVSLTPFFIWFLFKLINADRQSEFKFLHQFCNWIIFSGLISILFI